MAPSARFTEDFAYEVLSVVGEIPEGTVPPRGPGPLPRLKLRRLPLPPCRKPLRPPRPRLAGTGISATAGRRRAEGRDACGSQEISMGMLI